MILATDLDRTLIPNGEDEYDNSLPLLFDSLENAKFKLVYVSGRNLDLLNDAVKEYGIKLPDYFIGEVGTVIYRKKGESMVRSDEWSENISKENPNWDRKEIVPEIGMDDILELQEGWKQNDHKISYYLRDQSLKNEVMKKIRLAVYKNGTNAQVIWSVDPLQNTGLIDVLPESATKLTALEFIREKLGEDKEDVVYCGDSGNDILPLTSGYMAIVVRNAPESVKDMVMEIAKQKELGKNIYIAVGNDKFNGNYSSGIIEGLMKFGLIGAT